MRPEFTLQKLPLMKQYDYIIVGAGAAGSVLAARLSENPAHQVLLLEAGPDLAPGTEPPNVKDPFPGALGGSEYTWPGLDAEVFPERADRPAVRRKFIQGQVVGGSSSINGMMAQRGLPWDFDEWEACGATGWGWKDVLPYFKKMESDKDFQNPMHGNDGPLPIRREKSSEWAPFARAVTEAMQREGHGWFDDFNGEFQDGISPVPLNNLPDRRVSAAAAYLNHETRSRPNLTLMVDTKALKLKFEGQRAVGVQVRKDGQVICVYGKEIIVSSGAIHSPTLLLRSGVGPARELTALGIPTIADRPGVGRNLLNHLMIHVATFLRSDARQNPSSSSWAFTVLRYSSKEHECSAGDMQIFPINRTAWHALGQRIGAMGLCLYRPFSIGSVKLVSADPDTQPDIRFNMLVDPRDRSRLADGLKRMLILLADPQVARLCHEVFMPNKAFAGKLAARSWLNTVRTKMLAALLSLSGTVRRRALGASLLDPLKVAHDDNALAQIVDTATAHVHHVCGTCRIGAANDPQAVVDSECRVYDVQGLRVVDASLMPRNISANTHLATMMIAEKAAAHILGKH